MLYHYQKKQEVLESLSSNPQTGLSTQQVEKLTGAIRSQPPEGEKEERAICSASSTSLKMS